MRKIKFVSGERVRPTEEYTSTFPSSVTGGEGTVVRQNSRRPELYVVKWDGRKSDEQLHVNFLRPARDQ